jgi:hypothetical protein
VLSHPKTQGLWVLSSPCSLCPLSTVFMVGGLGDQ